MPSAPSLHLTLAGFLTFAVAACATEAASRQAPVACEAIITNVTIVDVDAGTLHPGQDVELCGARVGRVGPANGLPQSGRRIMDGRGRYLIPGLWDTHVHAFAEDLGEWLAPLMPANGVTSLRDMGFFPDTAQAARRALASRAIDGPRMLVSLRLDGPDNRTPWVRRARTGRDAIDAVRSARSSGMDFVKVYSRLPRDAYLSAAAEARRLGLPLDGHVPYSVSVDEAIAAGQRTIEHEDDLMRACSADDVRLRTELILSPVNASPPIQLALVREHAKRMRDRPDSSRCEAIGALLARSGVAVTPTLVVYQPYARSLPGLAYPERERFVSAAMRRSWAARLRRAAPSDTSVVAAYFSAPRTLMLHRAGVPILAGTDTPLPELVPGFSLHDELALLAGAGMTPLEVLRSATTRPATIFRMRDSLGAVKTGQLADLVLLDSNPLVSVKNLRRIRAVVANGVVHDSAALAGMLVRAERWARR